ncbi:MAG: MTH1187 family thiamine-binding protein [Methylococcaceae bacterium]|nr:MTH1187 family thiamine-binding protein [Methylococcaceae bacterium]
MHVSIDLCVVPLGVGVSVSHYVAACATVIRDAGLTFNINANNTEIEGEWDAVFAAVKRCHEVVHAMGAPRIVTSMRVNTRTDKVQSMVDKIHSVQTKLTPLQQ